MRVSIIGAGLGGLSCGVHLAARGARVTIYEKNARPGGRANVVEEMGYRIDMGPTLVLMPEVFEGVFRAAGKRMSDYLTLRKLDPAYRIFFAGGKRFDMTDNLERMLKQVGSFSPGAEKAFLRFRRDVQDKFESSRKSFIERNFDSLWDMVNLESLGGFLKIRPFGTAYDHAYGYFRDPELAAALSCQTLYLGDSPFRVPSLYNLLSFLEFTYGIWYPEGGTSRIPEALARLFRELGGTLRLETEAESLVVENGTATGVRLAGGTVELCDAVVSNRDVGASYLEFTRQEERPGLTDRKIRSWRYGQSTVMFYLGVKRPVEGLFHHNILLSADYRRSCRQIFEEGVLPDDPLLYVCVPTKTDPTLAPRGKEAVYILALAPNLQGKVDWEAEIPRFRERVFARLAQSGVTIRPEDIELERRFTPSDYVASYGALYGNAFGLAPDFFQSACFRPSTRSRDIARFYHTGASTHPGTGMPMVLMSGKLVAEQVAKDMGMPAPHRVRGDTLKT